MLQLSAKLQAGNVLFKTEDDTVSRLCGNSIAGDVGSVSCLSDFVALFLH